MNTKHLDVISRALAGRVSRRAALRGGTASLALTSIGQIRGASAQDGASASDSDTALESETVFLFVQTAAGGTLTPHPDEEGTYVLALTGASDQTVYFSDRPDRIVGTAPTQTFLDGLGFSEENPPNAALVAQTPAGEEIAVVELFEPGYDTTAGTLTYEARPLADFREAGLAHLAARQGDAELPATFGPASLFIDDCADSSVACLRGGDDYVGSIGPMGYCWSWNLFGCFPCASTNHDYWTDQCNATFDACAGGCIAGGIWELG